MSELTITLLRLGYLALLWIFVLTAIAVLRRDLYGTRIAPRRAARKQAAAAVAAGAEVPPTTKPARTPSLRLVVTEGPLTGTIVPLGSSSVLIGRAPSCTLVLDDDYSSSRHARIFPQAGAWFVEDLGSTNGTFIGDRKVESPVELSTGTPVRVGQSVIELQR
ncbi:FHA domain-containing protein [Cellulomonas sp. JH27-2]|uniref:FHA domain-containing protein FhaB/FipA n=1 Tax=Cellulomonas sp. JH27-2 TaxID=2774139 RepID=UPI0017813EAB|nr:FHA domain-containing protein [Cellulomonas sp. JH27-2]MBD8058304.1 FHA domain-containing protein [Cellulomonas sp. JH27-2]